MATAQIAFEGLDPVKSKLAEMRAFIEKWGLKGHVSGSTGGRNGRTKADVYNDIKAYLEDQGEAMAEEVELPADKKKEKEKEVEEKIEKVEKEKAKAEPDDAGKLQMNVYRGAWGKVDKSNGARVLTFLHGMNLGSILSEEALKLLERDVNAFLAKPETEGPGEGKNDSSEVKE